MGKACCHTSGGVVWEQHSSPGLEQVAFSRAKRKEDFAVRAADGEDLPRDQLLKIGQGRSHDKRRECEERLQQVTRSVHLWWLLFHLSASHHCKCHLASSHELCFWKV